MIQKEIAPSLHHKEKNWKGFHHKVNTFSLFLPPLREKKTEKKWKHTKPEKEKILSNSLFTVVLRGQKNWSKRGHMAFPLLQKKKPIWIAQLVRQLKTNSHILFFFLKFPEGNQKKKKRIENPQPFLWSAAI